MDNFNGSMGNTMLENGKMEIVMAMESGLIDMEIVIMVPGLGVEEKVMVYI